MVVYKTGVYDDLFISLLTPDNRNTQEKSFGFDVVFQPDLLFKGDFQYLAKSNEHFFNNNWIINSSTDNSGL